jgi:pentatricopeptide repeat protein
LVQVINACANGNRTDEALSVLQSVQSFGLTPNVYCYSAAAKSCVGRKRWREALALLDDARAAGVQPDATMYKTVLRCCWRARQWKSVLGIYGDMLAQGIEVRGASSWSSPVEAWSAWGDGRDST